MMNYPATNSDTDGKKVFRILKNATPDSVATRQKCTFIVIPSQKAGNWHSGLHDVIYKNGGDILEDYFHSENAVTILDEKYYFVHPDKDCNLPLDTFSSVYLYDVDKARRNDSKPTPDLNKYRLTASKYQECDANKILFYQMKWSDLPELEAQSSRLITAQQIVTQWKKNFDALPQVPPAHDLAEVKLRNEVCFVIHFQNQHFSLKLAPSENVRTLKSMVYSQYGIPPNQQLITGWPTAKPVSDTTCFKSLDLSDEMHIQLASAAPNPTNSPESFHSMQFSPKPTTSACPDSREIEGESRSRSRSISPNQTHENVARPCTQPTPVKIVPKPSTSAVTRRTKLVFRGVAGPNNVNIPPPKGKKLGSVSGDDRKARIDDESDEDVSFNEDEDNDNNDTESRSSKIKSRSRSNRFELAEGQQILDLICDNDAFLYTKGNKLWNLMANSKRFPGRTYQSLKEHYRKQILPNALKNSRYKISPGHLKRLQKAQDRSLWSKHANFCPNYVF